MFLSLSIFLFCLFLVVVCIKGAPGISGERGDQGKPGRAVSNKKAIRYIGLFCSRFQACFFHSL